MILRLFKSAVNRLGRRWGIRPFPWANDLSLATSELPRSAVFDAIHQSNHWESDESISGGGSTLERTADYAAALTHLIGQQGWRSMFDAPCGDLNWMRQVIDTTGIAYIGGDVSSHALDAARQRGPGLDLRLFDICSDDFPAVDLWQCRDCLFHLSNADALQALRNFARSDIPFALITSNSARWLTNIDIATGGWRLLDLQRAPFGLPKPVLRIKDYPEQVEFPRYVCLWTREQIAGAVTG